MRGWGGIPHVSTNKIHLLINWQQPLVSTSLYRVSPNLEKNNLSSKTLRQIRRFISTKFKFAVAFTNKSFLDAWTVPTERSAD